MLTVNGSTRKIEHSLPLKELLQEMNLSDQPCAVEVNKQLVSHREREHCILQDGDTVEIVTLVGGG